jgi:hypothetical protein
MERFYSRFANRSGEVGKEIFEIEPVILGGSPTDPTNKTLLTREEHIKAVVYWNRIVRDLRKQSSAPRT